MTRPRSGWRIRGFQQRVRADSRPGRGATPRDAASLCATRSRPAPALTQFALSSLALLILVAAIGAVTLKHLATNEALSDARSVTVAFSHGVLRREVTPGVLRGDPAALARARPHRPRDRPRTTRSSA